MENNEIEEKNEEVQDIQEVQEKKYKQYTIRFLNRAIRFLVSSEFFVIVFYFFSNTQDFLDSNLFIILNVIVAVAVLASIFSFAAIVLKIIYLKKHRNDSKYILFFILDILVFILSVIFSVFFSLIVVISKGNI